MGTKTKKAFDCVALQRRLRKDLSSRWSKMTREEIIADANGAMRRWLKDRSKREAETKAT